MNKEKASKILCIVIPAYNEEEKIANTITALNTIRAKTKRQGIRMNLCVVNDGSTDGTAEKIKNAGVDMVVTHKKNRGLGAAIRSGLTAARNAGADIVVKFDADLQHNPDDVLRVIQPLLDDDADVVYGNRFRMISYRMPLIRRMGNIVFTGMMRFLTKWPLKDSQPGIFAINRDYLDKFYLPGDYNYTQQILLDAYHKGMRFTHVDVDFKKRETGKSFVSLKYPLKVMPQIFWVIVSVKPLRIFMPIGVLFLCIGIGFFTYELVLYFLAHSPKPVVHVNLVLGSTLFGLQVIFFGILAELIVRFKK